jgi:ATP-dependent Clp protease ATP-binding subunit ClpB
MRLDKLTTKFQLALADAQSLAVGRDHQFIEPVHVLSAMLDQEGSTVRQLLSRSGVEINRLRSQLGEALDRLPQVQGAGGEVHISKNLESLLNLTDKLAQKRHDSYISSELFVLAALESKDDVARILNNCGVDKDSLTRAVDDLRGGQKVEDPNAEENRQTLEKYGTDLTARARAGQDRSGDRPRSRDPPRAAGAVPPHQEQPGAHRRTRCRQDRHRRRPRPPHRFRRCAGLDEKQTRSFRWTSAACSPVRNTAVNSRTPQGIPQGSHRCRRPDHPLHRRTPHHRRRRSKPRARWMLGNLLKPQLARGELHAIGATTLDEYRKYIEKDAALERTLPTGDGRRAVGRGHRRDPARPQGTLRSPSRRAHPGWRIVAAAALSDRYISDRFLPDKAVDLIDEAPSRLKIELDSMPTEIDVLERQILQLEMEKKALKRKPTRPPPRGLKR